ncbi:MAG TPA: RNA methyltransferase [Castellaniella sp.]|uniref:TrmH family RNA methyltransferase n=1 Tax=Castellaniella sp. TaxID=1955812 RepID=UPI002EF594B5
MTTDSTRHIASRENPDFRVWMKLSQGRGGRGAALLEGQHLCEAWCEAQGMPDMLIVGEAAQTLPWVQSLWIRCASARRVVLQDSLARELSRVEQGPAVFCIVRPPAPELPPEIHESCLCLDRVQDPGNLGTLLRTAAAAGLRQIFLSTGCVQAWAPKVLRSGQGAHFVLAIHERVELPELFERLAVPLAVTTLDRADSLYALDLRGPCAWLFGNEGQGVAPQWQTRATRRVRIPQAPQVESLNVAAAAAICLFEQRRQQLSTSSDPGPLRP